MTPRPTESSAMRPGSSTSASGKTASASERRDAGNRFAKDPQAEMSLQADGWNFRLIV